MDIQWIIIAREFRTNLDTTMCIDGIFHHLRRVSPDKNVAMLLIAKLKPSITEIGEIKVILDSSKPGEQEDQNTLWILLVTFAAITLLTNIVFLIKFHRKNINKK